MKLKLTAFILNTWSKKMIKKYIFKFTNALYRGFNKIIIVPGLKSSFAHCGENVNLSYDIDVRGNQNIYVGSNVQIGPHAILWTTRAKIIFKDNVLIGPSLTVITGDHRTDVKGKHIIQVTDDEKLPEHDADVIIEEGVWIGANVTILKGVTIKEGAVIAAGSVVTKNVEPYTICAGVPCKKVKDRFREEELKQHKQLLKVRENEKNLYDCSR